MFTFARSSGCQAPLPCRRIVIRNNKLSDCGTGIWVSGVVSDLHIVGNLVWASGDYAIGLQDLFAGSSGIVIANNTIRDPRTCVQVMAPVRGVRDVAIRNNLFLAEQGPDLVFVGKDRQDVAAWRLDHNWRRVRRPDPAQANEEGWLMSSADTFVESVELLSSNPQHSQFLRPPAKSVLGSNGAGKDLPGYVGALPPEGVEVWDWDRTWKAHVSGEGSSLPKGSDKR